MNKKAIKIDLSTFFDDERKMTFILIDPNWKSVECLQKRIEYLFGVESVRFLSDGYFLPPQESIEIVKFCNDLKAFVPKDILEKRKKKKYKKSKNKEKSIDLEESSNEDVTTVKSEHINDSQKKRKSTSLGNEAKRTKSSVLSEITSTSETLQSTTPKLLEVNNENGKNKKSKSKLSKVSLVTTNYEEQDASMEDCSRLQDCQSKNARNLEEEEENTLVQRDSIREPKNRLTSTPKERKTSEIVEEEEQRTSVTDEAKMTVTRHSSIPSSTFLSESKMPQPQRNSSPNPNNPFKKPKSSRAHIYFNDSGEIVNPSTQKTNEKTPQRKNDKETKTIIIFRCPLSDTTNDKQKPRVFNLQTTNNANAKPIVEIQEHIIIPPQANDSSSPSKETFALNGHQDNKENSKVEEDMESTAEKSCAYNTTNNSDNTTIANNTNKEETTEVSPTTTNESQLQRTTTGEAEAADNETSVMSVDCVDLSLDLDDYDKKEQNRETPIANRSKTDIEEKHDLTRDEDDEDNNSSTSDVEEISEVIDLNDTEDNCEESVNQSTIYPTSMKDIKVNKILPFCVNINDMPNIGNIVLFKMRYFNKKQKFIETNYIAGKAEYINRRTKSIKFFIIDGASELDHLPNQFICNLDDSQDSIKYIQVKFSEMLQPKLFTSS